MRQHVSFVRTGRTRMFLFLLGLLICNFGWATTFNIEYRFGNNLPRPTHSNPATYTYNAEGGTISLAAPDPISVATFDHWEVLAWWDSWRPTTVTAIDCSWDPNEAGYDKIILQAVYRDFVKYTIEYELPEGVANDPSNPTTFTFKDTTIFIYPIPNTVVGETGYRHSVVSPSGNYVWRFKNKASGEYYSQWGSSNFYVSSTGSLPISAFRGNPGNIIAVPQLSTEYVVTVICEKGIVITLDPEGNTSLGGPIRVTENNSPYQFSFSLGGAMSNFPLWMTKETEDWNPNYKYLGMESTKGNVTYNEGVNGFLYITGSDTITFKSTRNQASILYLYMPTLKKIVTDEYDNIIDTIDFWYDGESPITRSFTLDYPEEQTLTIPDVSLEGVQGLEHVRFDGWFHDSLLTDPASSTVTIPAYTCYRANTVAGLRPYEGTGWHGWVSEYFQPEMQRLVTYYSKWSMPIEYYDEGGTAYSGTNRASLPERDVIYCRVTLPDGEKTGYNFLGWYEDEDCTLGPITRFCASNDGRERPCPTIAYAKWSVTTYDITLDKGTDGTTDGSATATYDSNTLTDVTHAVKTDWVLLGYFTAATGGVQVINADGTLIANVDGYTDASGNWTRTSGSMTLYAQWAAKPTVTLESNNTNHGRVLSEGVEIGAINNVTPNAAIIIDGASLTINGTTVTATPSDANGLCTYSFDSWKNGETVLAGSGNVVSEDMTITAHFSLVLKDELTLNDLAEASYYDSLKTLYHNKYMTTVTYNRTFTEGNWSTLCLPFEVNKFHLEDNGLTDQVFRFNYAVGDAEVDSGIELHFGRTNTMTAGQAYLVKTGETKSEPFIFDEVTINTSADNQNLITDLPGYNNGTGTITLVGTLRKGTLPKSDKHYMGLSGNKIYYPGSNATVPAYRAFFKESNPAAVVQRRARLVMEDEQGTPIEVIELVVVDEQATSVEVIEMDGKGNLMPVSGEGVRKYIENGVLIIERNGKRYTAQGNEL